ncbi:hypothetical protein [Bacteroides congonensis]
MNVILFASLIYPFIRHFVKKLPLGRKTTIPVPSEPEVAGVLNFLCVQFGA